MAGRNRRGRPVNGVVLLDKPVGPSSNQALQTVKRLFRAQKAGHTGSLDPLASGMLPVCLGEATKVSGYLLESDKTYRVRCKLGERTSTGDAEGEVLSRQTVGPFAEGEVEAVLRAFRGAIEQIPPMYSALHHGGERLYDLARRGVEVERAARRVIIHSLTLIDLASENLEFEVCCSKGTYVRTLVEDIGTELGCGAHVLALHRCSVQPYREQQMVGLERLQELEAQGLDALDEMLLPVDSALQSWPKVQVNADMAFFLRRGQPVLVPRVSTLGWVRLYEGSSTFIGLGEVIDDGRVAPRRIMNNTPTDSGVACARPAPEYNTPTLRKTLKA